MTTTDRDPVPDDVRAAYADEIDTSAWTRLSPHRYSAARRADPTVHRLVLRTPIGTASTLWWPNSAATRDQEWAGLWDRVAANWAREAACLDGQPPPAPGVPDRCAHCGRDRRRHETPAETGQQTWQVTHNNII